MGRSAPGLPGGRHELPEPVHLLVDEHGDEVRDSEGRRVGPVEIPPGCRVKARHERD